MMNRVIATLSIITALATVVSPGNAVAQPRPSKALVAAVKKEIPQSIQNNSDFVSRTEYFFTEVDLNGDGIKEAVVVIRSPMCGAWECNAYIFQKNGKTYQKIGRVAVMSNMNYAEVGVLPSKRKGWSDLVTHVYNSPGKPDQWNKSIFDGTRYKNNGEQVNRPSQSQIVLHPKDGSGIKLSEPGI